VGNEKSTYPALLGMEQSRQLVNDLTENAVAALDIFENGSFLADYAKKLASRTN